MAKKSGKAVPKKKPVKASVKKARAKNTATRSTVSAGSLRRKPTRHKILRFRNHTKRPVKLPNAWQLTKQAALNLWQHRRLFIGITLIYGLLNLVLAQGLSGSTDISTLKHDLNQGFTGNFGFLASGLSIFVVLVGSAGNTTNQTAGAYQVFLAVVSSLAIIWALRQVSSGAYPRIRDAYYRGMYPLIPFLLVLVVISLQLIPLVVGSTLYALVINNGIAAYAAEKLFWVLIFAALALLTFYMLSSSVFALYIVTLPDMTPMKALRSARELVRYRRWAVFRKIFCLPVILLVVAAVIMLPIIAVLTPLAQWIFFLLTMFALVAIHAYMYALYRELLNE